MLKPFIYIFVGVTICLLAGCEESTDPAEETFGPVGRLELPGRPVADCWGFVHESDGKEYAIVGHWPIPGVTLVDVSDPARPVEAAYVDSVMGFDVKYWNNHVYAVTGSSQGPGIILDVSNPGAPIRVGTFPGAHNIYISDDGLLIAESIGVKIYDLTSDPASPDFLWQGGTEGHDATVVGDRLFDFHGRAGTNIYDISNPSSPMLLGAIKGGGIAYHHSGWPTEDGNYLFICDELAAVNSDDFSVWDIRDLDNIERVAGFNDPEATIHNLYIINDLAYVSYYSAGFRVFDISDPSNPTVLKHFDTSDSFGPNFDGAFGCYPFSPSGIIFVSDDINGLFIFKLD